MNEFASCYRDSAYKHYQDIQTDKLKPTNHEMYVFYRLYDISHDLLAAQLFMFSLVCLNNEMLKEIVLCFKEIDDPFS